MARKTLLLALALLALTNAGHASPVADAGEQQARQMEAFRQRTFAELAPTVVFLRSGQRVGSGFFVNAEGLILTSRHVVGPSEGVRVVCLDGAIYSGKVVEKALEDVDLALVQVEPKAPTAFLALSTTKPKVGAWVASIGHGAGAIWTFNTGMVSNIYTDKRGARPMFQTDMAVNPGSSGGPVIDLDGRAVGIVTAGVANAQSVNFAIQMDYAKKMLHGI